MPLQVNKLLFNNINVSIWRIDETEDFLISNLDLSINCKKRLNSIKSPSYRKQFLSVRALIKYNDINLNDLFYDSNGAPFLKNNLNISISHTNNYSAIALSKNPVGIDIQDYREKILSIRDKFINEFEIELIDTHSVNDLTILWSIKESIYKIYKKQGLNFKKNIIVQKITKDFKDSLSIVNDMDKKTFFKSKNIIHSNYICSIVKVND